MAGLGAGTFPVATSAAGEIRNADALVVARQVFQDFELSAGDLQDAAWVLGTFSGGEEFQRILDRAMKKPGAPWDSIGPDRRQSCVSSAMRFHCSAADMERMALRAGAGLALVGKPELGRKILQEAPDSSFGVEPVGVGMWIQMARLLLMTFMIAVIVAQSAVTGVWGFVAPAIAAVVVTGVVIWLLERNAWKLKREEGEAHRYLRALGRLDTGSRPADLFLPDGSLRSAA